MSPKPAPAGGAAVDALLEPGFLENATTQPMSEVRRLRREAEQQEVNLSYTRRLLQGRLDIVRRELQRRAEHDGRSLVDLLPEILSEKGRGPAHGLGRHQTVQPHAPEEYESWVNSLTAGSELTQDSYSSGACGCTVWWRPRPCAGPRPFSDRISGSRSTSDRPSCSDRRCSSRRTMSSRPCSSRRV